MLLLRRSLLLRRATSPPRLSGVAPRLIALTPILPALGGYFRPPLLGGSKGAFFFLPGAFVHYFSFQNAILEAMEGVPHGFRALESLHFDTLRDLAVQLPTRLCCVSAHLTRFGLLWVENAFLDAVAWVYLLLSSSRKRLFRKPSKRFPPSKSQLVVVESVSGRLFANRKKAKGPPKARKPGKQFS